MIPIPNNFDNAKAYDGGAFPKLPVGGHICRVHSAQMAKNNFGADMLVINFDVQEGTEWDGYYRRKNDLNYRRSSAARWPGVFSVNLLNRDGDCSGFFKGLIKAMEESNPGYSFRATGGNETAMTGLYIGLVFRERDFMTQDTHEVRTVVEPFYACPVARIHEGVEIPPRKGLPAHNTASAPAQDFKEVDDDELPF